MNRHEREYNEKLELVKSKCRPGFRYEIITIHGDSCRVWKKGNCNCNCHCHMGLIELGEMNKEVDNE